MKEENLPEHIAQQPMGPMEQLLREQRLKWLGDIRGLRVLDIGVGSGEVWKGCRAGEGPVELSAVEPDRELRTLSERSGLFDEVWPDVPYGRVSEFDVVTAMGVLEHVDEPAEFLSMLKESKRLFLTVPNGDSFHRYVGLRMGALSSLEELQAHDLAIGHQRYFTYDSFRELLTRFALEHGFRLIQYGTLGFKFGSNAQMVAMGAAPHVFAVAEQLGMSGLGSKHGSECFALLTRTA